MTGSDLQTLLDTTGVANLPAGTVTLSQPLILSPSGDHPITFTGAGERATVLVCNNTDAIVVLPPATRNADPSTYWVPNALDPTKVAFRTRSQAGIYWHSTILDKGRTAWKWWSQCRQFTVEFHVTRNGTAGGVCGMMTSTREQPSPWWIRDDTDPAWAGYMDAMFQMPDGTRRTYRFFTGLPTGGVEVFRMRVNLDTGVVVFERNGVACPARPDVGPSIQPGDTLAENAGAPFWLGGICSGHGGGPQEGSWA